MFWSCTGLVLWRERERERALIGGLIVARGGWGFEGKSAVGKSKRKRGSQRKLRRYFGGLCESTMMVAVAERITHLLSL